MNKVISTKYKYAGNWFTLHILGDEYTSVEDLAFTIVEAIYERNQQCEDDNTQNTFGIDFSYKGDKHFFNITRETCRPYKINKHFIDKKGE